MPHTLPLPLSDARKRFFDGEELPEGTVAPAILRSWQRCLALGLPANGLHSERLESTDLAHCLDANHPWLQLARLQVENLYESVVDDGHVVIVADKHGMILEQIGHPDFLDKAERVALTPGMDWREDRRGTNAIGTALLLNGNILVRGREHYLERNRQLACVASAILDPFGAAVGVLDVSGLPRKLGQAHVSALEAATRQIEHRLFEAQTRQYMTLWLHHDPAQVMSPRAARLAFDDRQRLFAANRAAMQQLQLPWDALGKLSFADVFGETLEHWQHRAGQQLALLHGARQIFSGKLIMPASPPPASAPARPQERPLRAESMRPAPQDDSGLPPALLTTARKLLEADIPVLILGETGTGKDQFARALHAESSRSQNPFVAVNCAAIPDGLVETELFGYEEGAFTGARRQGSRGRLREAHGGILFLDEIGDMPLTLQARLLRVLQDRVVMPLGGGTPQKVDIRLICATHRDLRQMLQQGSFRADLYYRLSHYPLNLPPLRSRGDVATIAQRLLDAHGAASRGVTLSAELASAFRRYPWPGNLREMSNLLQTLLALVEDHTTLTLKHLPEILLEDMQNSLSAKPEVESTSAARILQRFGGNASAAARALGISRSTLYRKLKQGRS
jgi:transcriptional regulator of acetoin/glycerol metabolism